ncbi:hypothetical protein SBV1_3510001 [Verrucomicrobia bacterium]|nr:hypothetical protein SBV1_3510001 [Verrucomicrobiota bacterium]
MAPATLIRESSDPGAHLVSATEPVPQSQTSNLHISNSISIAISHSLVANFTHERSHSSN